MIEGLIAAAIGRLMGLSGLSKLFIIVAVAAVVAAGLTTAYGIWHHEVYRSGYDRAMLDIASADAKAIGRASELRNTWRGCVDGGKSWDQTTGVCQ